MSSLLEGVASVLIAAALLVSCAPPQVEQSDIQVTVINDGKKMLSSVPSGSTALDVIEMLGVAVGELDRSEPPLFTVVSDGDEVHFIRVREEFEIEEIVIPFERQILRNESLPEGEQRLIQPGVNGLQEITYRRLFEDGVEINRSIVKTMVIAEAVPEVVMIGSQALFAAVPIAGRLAYLSAGNAWVMETSTHNRRPVVTTGDLDGRVFSLSPDGVWLLYTRNEEDEDVINSLWVSKVDDDSGITVDLRVENVIWFADWVPNSNNGIVFSTVEPITTAPGWQANNDLQFITFSENGWASTPRVALAARSGGVYGWWGTMYVWSPDGKKLAYARPDSIGLVNLELEQLEPLLEITPLQTGSDWAWTPGIAWSKDGYFLYAVDHLPQEGGVSLAESQSFGLIAIPVAQGVPVPLVTDTGMFAYPTASSQVEGAQQIAYLQALVPLQSETSGYRLIVSDRDGSNTQILFPEEGKPGLTPQAPVWSPAEDGALTYLAVVYNGNLWLIDPAAGTSQQITGDGSIAFLDWK